MISFQSLSTIFWVLCAVAIGVVFVLRRRLKSHAFKQGADIARQVFPVWAALGPFESGKQSATAMRHAALAVLGNEGAELMAEAFIQHIAAYDSRPTDWEQTRQQAARSLGPDNKKFVSIARALAATDKAEILGASQGGRKLEWSSNPGAYESHLMRRHNNPYFPESRRIVSQEELDGAKRQDMDDYVLCQQRLAELEKEIKVLSSSGDLLKFRERLDELIFFSMGVGGPAKEIAIVADQLRDAVIADLRAAFSSDEQTLENIERVDALHKDNTRKFYIPVMAQMLRINSPVLKEESIPTILSADPLAISVFMDFLPNDVRASVRVEALKMMQAALNDGYIDPRFEEKLSALEGK